MTSKLTEEDFTMEEPKDDDDGDALLFFKDEPTTLLNQPNRNFGELLMEDIEGIRPGNEEIEAERVISEQNMIKEGTARGSPLAPQMMWNPTDFSREELLNSGIDTPEKYDKFIAGEDWMLKQEDEKAATISMRQVNPALFQHAKVKFDESSNKLHKYTKPKSLSMTKGAIRMRKSRQGKKKGGKRRTRKKRGGMPKRKRSKSTESHLQSE